VPVKFEDPVAVSPDINQWMVDGKVIDTGSNVFAYTFNMPGLYQVKHCHGQTNCATRYVYVRNPIPAAEEMPMTHEIPPITNTGNGTAVQELRKSKKEPKEMRPDPIMPPVPPPTKTPEERPVDKPINKQIGKPPENFKNTAITGLSSGSYKTDCVNWVESTSVQISVNDWCELYSASVIGDGAGKLMIELTDGDSFRQSMVVTLNPGKTNFSFAAMGEAVLQPGREYTLRIRTQKANAEKIPKIGNISKCTAGEGIKTSALSILYGSELTLFDLKIKY